MIRVPISRTVPPSRGTDLFAEPAASARVRPSLTLRAPQNPARNRPSRKAPPSDAATRHPVRQPFIVGKELFYIAQAVTYGNIAGDSHFTSDAAGCSKSASASARCC